MSRPDKHWSNADPAEWPVLLAKPVIVAHDFGVSNDHSTIVAAGVWPMAGKSQMGIFHAEQMPLNLPPSEIAETLIKYVNELRPHVLVLDTRGQRSHAETVLNNISCPVVGISTTGQELHATRPQPVPMIVHGKRTALPVYSLSRTALIEDLLPMFEHGTLNITEQGHGALIVTELHDMDVQVNETTGNRRWTTKPNAHDDLAISAGMARWGAFELATTSALRTSPKVRKQATRAPMMGGWT